MPIAQIQPALIITISTMFLLRLILMWGGEHMLGTNPIATAFPGKEEPPIVIDMATSTAAYGKIEMPAGLAIPSLTAGKSTAKGV